ncbi:MAG TPA: hypothetical protein VN706_24665 [Gemmatimonadaceae bacterium]|nr:hypothetical protein [Gemmatimonadaceae bacterium]
MSRFIFAIAAFVGLTSAAVAQQVPGRDLLEFPLGLLADSPPLSRTMPGGFWNPANGALNPGDHAAIGFSGLTTPQEQGIRLQMIGGELRVSPTLTATMTFANASVSDIIRTATDPQSLGEIPYGTSVVSGGLSARQHNISYGAALRYRWATLDLSHSHSLALDGGVSVDGVAGTPVRLAASTFLFSVNHGRETPTYMLGADMPVVRRDSILTLRAGYSASRTTGRGRDDYAFTSASFRQLDVSAGVSQTSAYGSTAQRLRLGVGLRYANYDIAFGREDGAAGFGASYQFLISRVFR